jgi:hypothetical protein
MSKAILSSMEVKEPDTKLHPKRVCLPVVVSVKLNCARILKIKNKSPSILPSRDSINLLSESISSI